MAGMPDYTAANVLSYQTRTIPLPALTAVYLGLFTTAPTSDSGVTGAVEASGTNYARVQVAGQLAAGASFTTASTTITLGTSAPAWLTALGSSNNGNGVNVYDITNSQPIGTVASISGTTVTLTGTAAHASSGTTDTLAFSAFGVPSNSSGSEPSVTPANATNGAQINFAQAGGTGWGTSVAFGLFDAPTSGNLLNWDYLGNFKWIPFTCTSASPGVLTVDATADAPANGTSCVVTGKFGGTLPTTGGSWAGVLTSAGLSGATFNLGVNTTSIGGGQFRQVASQPIAQNITPYFPASSLTLNQA